jgi:hypothetical protein
MHLLSPVTQYKDKVVPVTEHNSGTDTKLQHPRHLPWVHVSVKLLTPAHLSERREPNSHWREGHGADMHVMLYCSILLHVPMLFAAPHDTARRITHYHKVSTHQLYYKKHQLGPYIKILTQFTITLQATTHGSTDKGTVWI